MHPGYCHDGANNQDGVCLPINNEDIEGGGSLIFDGAEEDFHQIINLNSAVQTQIDGPRDADAFMFIAPAAGTYRFGTRHAHEGQGQLWANTGDFNTVCHLSTMGGQIVRWNDDPPIVNEEAAENTHCQVEIELRADHHAYLLIHAFDLWAEEDPTPHFEVYVECAEEGACGQEDDHGDVGDPTHIGELEEPLTINGQINHRNDVDAFTFTATERGGAEIGLDEAPSHLFLEVRAAGAGNPILNSCEVPAATNICAAEVTVSEGSLYSVSVRGLNNATGTYRLFVRQGN